MNTKHVLVTIPVEESHVKQLQDAAPQWEFRFRGGDNLIYAPRERAVQCPPLSQEDVDWANVLLGNVPPSMLTGSPALEWVQTGSAGVEDYIKPGVLAPDALLTNATGAYGLAIAEHMLGMLLMLLKKLELYRDAQRTGAWQSQGAVKAVYGSTVLVLGMGDIGGEFGRRCKALGAKVIGVRRSPRPCRTMPTRFICWRTWISCCPRQMWLPLPCRVQRPPGA